MLLFNQAFLATLACMLHPTAPLSAVCTPAQGIWTFPLRGLEHSEAHLSSVCNTCHLFAYFLPQHTVLIMVLMVTQPAPAHSKC